MAPTSRILAHSQTRSPGLPKSRDRGTRLLKSQVFGAVNATQFIEQPDFVASLIRQVAPFEIADLVTEDF